MPRSLIVVMTGLMLFGETTCGAASAAECQLHIVALGDTIITLADIATADCSTGTLALTDAGAARWQRWAIAERHGDHVIPKLSRLCGADFQVVLDRQTVAVGHFTSLASSRLHDGLLISDALIVPGVRNLGIGWGCCMGRSQSEIFAERDRFMAQFWNCLRQAGKLSGECGAS